MPSRDASLSNMASQLAATAAACATTASSSSREREIVAAMNERQLNELNRILSQNVDERATGSIARYSDDVTATCNSRAANVPGGGGSGANSSGTNVDKKSRILRLVKQLKNIERKRSKDTKAIKTLGIIMGKKIFRFL